MALWSGLLARPARTPLYNRPSLTLFFLLAGAFILTLLPHAAQFPLWLSATVIVAIILRAILEIYRLPLPSTTLSGFVAIVFLGVIFATYHNIAGRDAGTALTAGLLTIKFYEIRRPRDIALVIFSCFFVVMSSLLYSQVLELFVYCLIMMWVLTALLLRVHAGDSSQDRLLRMLQISGIIFLQALPLMLFLFFFFPRYTGTISFAMGESKIGLTDTVSPGSIAKLSQDDSEAMYVEFTNGNVPTTDTMYMRGIVLWDYTNGTWTPGGDIASVPSRKTVLAVSGPGDIKQKITVRAHNQKWLFALDVPVSVPVNDSESFSWATMLDGDIIQLSGNAKLNHQARYSVTSSPERAEEELTPEERYAGTRLPDAPNDKIDPGVVQLADRLHQGLSAGQEEVYISNVLRYFHRGGFTYSATPGVQGADWLPAFLLQTKTGFCEHFASAFAVLMRQEHIPARVIAGYLGADYNPYSDKYLVSQSNAHAWDEVWIPSDNLPPDRSTRGRWVRVDPTSLIGSLGQVASRAEDAADALSRQIAQHKPTFAEAYLPAWAKNALKEMQLRREQVEAGWDDLVFSYDPEAQIRLAQALGFGEKAPLGLLLLSLATCVVWYFGVRTWITRKPRVSPVENLYAAFCRHMAQRGIPRATWEGPLAYTDRVAEAFPDDKTTLQRVGSIVAQARYGPVPPDSATPDNLKSLLTLLSASLAAATSRERI
jgi:transglutaminase-like putative cysteine protease